MSLFQVGVTTLFRGMRRGNVWMALGGAIVTYASWRRRRSDKRREVTRIVIKAGDTAAFRVTAKGSEPASFAPPPATGADS